jgi:hypothetical protein
MKTLQQRLDDYKVMKKEILNGETENGYSVKYSGTSVTFSYKELDNRLVVERHRKNPYWGDGKAVRILESNESVQAKNICYNEMINYLRKNSHVEYKELWDNQSFPRQASDGSILVVKCFPFSLGSKISKFGELPRNARERISRERLERGFPPASCFEKI